MTLDPQIASLLPLLAQAPPLSTSTPEAARAGMRLVTVDLRDVATFEQVKSTEDITYPAAEGDLRARVYRPEADGPVPTVLFLHGGGYVMGDIDTHEDQARLLCNRLGAVVVSVDYRLAPEHPFPAGHLDALAAYRWVVDHVATLGGDPSRIGVAGDSAGGNLAAGVAHHARDHGLPLKAQLLIYPGIDFTEDEDAHPSRLENGEGFLLTVDDMHWFREHYKADATDPRASVILAELEGVAPAIVATAEYDPLRDEGVAYAQLLEKAGVAVRQTTYPGMIHGFFGLGLISPGAQQANEDICRQFKELLG